MKFNRIYLEITNLCNFECSFCPIKDRPVTTLAPNSFFKIASEVKPFTKELCLHLMGEPLSHPQFREIISSCDELGITVMLTTNGLLIQKYQEDLMAFKGLRQINFSIQSYQDNFPNENPKDYLGRIYGFTKEAFEKRAELFINYRLWNLGTKGSNEFYLQDFEKQYGIHLKREVDVRGIKSKKIINRLYVHFDSRFEWPSFDLPFQSLEGRCHGLSQHIGIHGDGTVVPCCLDQKGNIPLGNIFEESFVSIINSPRAKAIREGFAVGKRVEKFCQHCSFANRF